MGAAGAPFGIPASSRFLCSCRAQACCCSAGGKTLILPKAIIEFVFPFAILPPEKLFLTTLTGMFKGFGVVALADFDRVDVFVQQFFVLSILFSILILTILTLQARAGYLYPMPNENTAFGIVKMIAIFFLLRQFLICLLVGNPVPHDSRAELIGLLLRATAPGFLIMVTCATAILIWGLALLGWRAASSPLG